MIAIFDIYHLGRFHRVSIRLNFNLIYKRDDMFHMRKLRVKPFIFAFHALFIDSGSSHRRNKNNHSSLNKNDTITQRFL